MRSRLLVVFSLLAACGRGGKLSRVADAGPAVMVVDHSPSGAVITQEREPNDTGEGVSAIPFPLAARGTIGKGGDRDVFLAEVPYQGILAARLSGISDADLVFEVRSAQDKLLALSDNGPKGIVEGVPNLVLGPGTYRLVVREFEKPSRDKTSTPAPLRTSPSTPYLLEASLGLVPALGHEAEPNDGSAFAGILPPGQPREGYVGWRKDRDTWRVPLEGIGEDQALSVDVTGLPGVPLTVSISDGTEVILVTRSGKAGEAVALRNIAVRPGEPAFFVVVTGPRGNLDERYSVHVSTAPFQLDEEEEPNDTPTQAAPLSEVPSADSGIRVGFLVTGDKDYFRLAPSPTARTLHVTLEPPPDVDATLALVSEAGKEIVPALDVGKKGAKEHLQGVHVPEDAPVLVRITAKGIGNPTMRYRLRWSAVMATEPALLPGVLEE
ncbi:MAG: hypothetical protein HY698_18430 [Deltaproteobacteria bacterium]|nr:hypothetical protein [Deltaproteobacteria bacterium]